MVHGALLAETLKRLEEIKECTKDLDGSTGHSRVSHTNSFGNTGGIQTRTMKLEFPRFDGANPTGWLFNAKRYFAYHQVPGAQWLAVASLKVEGEALDWYQWYTDYAPHATWKEFVEAMDARFGPTRSEDFVGKQSKLRQYSSVFEYQREFRRLSNRVKGLDEKILTSMYLSGLRDDIRIGVQKLNPSNLPEAFSLARLQEEEANLQRRRMLRMEVGRPTLAANPSEVKHSLPAIRRLTPNEARDRRMKGLCYHCDKKYTRSNRCKIQKLLWVEGLLQDEEEDGGQIVEDADNSAHHELNEDDLAPQISVHAIAGTRTPQTMRISGTLKQCPLTILIDSGFTHNFIDPIVIRRANIPTQSDAIFEVIVANGERLKGNGYCKGVVIHSQGIPIQADFFLSSLRRL